MCVGQVDEVAALDAVLVPKVEADVVLNVELPQSLVTLEREAEEVAECVTILVSCVDVERGAD